MEADIYSKQVTSFSMVQAGWPSTQKVKNAILRLGRHTLDNPAGPLTSCIYVWKCFIVWLQILCPRIQHWLKYKCKHIIIYKCVLILGWVLEFQSDLCKLRLEKCLFPFFFSYISICTELDKLYSTLFWIRTISGNVVYFRGIWTENSLQSSTYLFLQ